MLLSSQCAQAVFCYALHEVLSCVAQKAAGCEVTVTDPAKYSLHQPGGHLKVQTNILPVKLISLNKL